MRWGILYLKSGDGMSYALSQSMAIVLLAWIGGSTVACLALVLVASRHQPTPKDGQSFDFGMEIANGEVADLSPRSAPTLRSAAPVVRAATPPLRPATPALQRACQQA
jgi:hypothetical protein